MMATLKVGHYEFKVSDKDFCNVEELFSYAFDRKKPNVYMMHDHGFVICIVVASCLQDALDIAVDENRLDRFLVSDEDLKDYGEEGEGLTYLGNASEAFDIESLGVEEIPFPNFSPLALYVAAGAATPV